MLKIPDQVSTQQQQARTNKEASSKAAGNTISLLKATSKVLAFLNPTGRKPQPSSISEQEDHHRHLLESELFFPQANSTNNHQRRGPIREQDEENVEQFKHLFQNRPVNRYSSTLPNEDNYAGVAAHSNHYTQINNSTSVLQDNSTFTYPLAPTHVQSYTEQDQQLAKERLQAVRRNLKNHGTDSSYFKTFAPLVDDWRNFLPETELDIHDNNSNNIAGMSNDFSWMPTRSTTEGRPVTHSRAWRGPQDYRQDFFDARSNMEDDLDDEYSMDSQSDEEHLVSAQHKRVSVSQLGTMPASSSSTTSFVKERLREEELCRLVSASHLCDEPNATGAHYNSVTGAMFRNRDEKNLCDLTARPGWNADFSSLLDGDDHYISMFHRNNFAEDTDANDADADDNDGEGTLRSKKGARLRRVPRGNRTKRHGHRASRSAEKGGVNSGDKDYRCTLQRQRVQQKHSQGHVGHKVSSAHSKSRVGSNDIKRLGVTHQVDKSSGGRTKRSHGHASGIGFADIARGVEAGFTLGADEDGAESEDSLTYLISEYENGSPAAQGVAGQEPKAFLARMNPSDTLTSSSEDLAASIASESSASPNSTLLNSSDSRSDSSEEVESPSQTLVDARDLPPQYSRHEQDPALVLPQSNQASSGHGLLAQATQAAEMQSKNVKPSLTLQTLTHTLGGIAPGALSAFESRPLGSQYSLTKCNSTSSLYIDSTMTKNDVDETLRAVATVLYEKVLHSHRVDDCRTERIINSSSYVPSERVVMTQADIFDFMRFIFDCGQNLGAENAIITLIYVERMTDLGGLSFHAINWRRLLLGALILSIKVWEDLAVFNSDVCAIFEGLSVKDVNALERFSMAKLQYNVSVKRSLYASYYFRLRDVSEAQHNLHYGKLTLSMSQRDMRGPLGSSQHGSGVLGLGAEGAGVSSILNSRDGSRVVYQGGSGTGLSGMGMVGLVGSNNSSNPSKVPVGPGHRKWTLKPLSVREADRLEARSSVYSSNVMMEEQERKDMGCCWDEYTGMGRALPEELCLSSTLASSIAGSSMHTISSSSSNNTHGQYQDAKSKATAAAAGSGVESVSTLELSAGREGEVVVAAKEHGTEPVKRVLRLKKSRSDFFFQNSTPASIM